MKTNDFITRIEEIYSGNPWYGNSILETLKNINSGEAVKEIFPGGHTMVDLIYHMITWRYFTVKQLQGDGEYDVKQNDQNDWRAIDYNKKNLWEDTLSDFENMHKALLTELKNFKDEKLEEKIPARNFTYEYLLSGLIQHDIYHLGQIGLIKSALKKNKI
jgi:uncharacterized damage-inducible protein DinB